MGTDKISITSEIDANDFKGSFFAHLLLNHTKTEDIAEIAKSLKNPGDKVEVDLRINGKQLFVKDFNAILLEWFGQIEKRQQAQYEKLATEEGLMEKAQEIVREKMGVLIDHIDSLKNECANRMEDWDNYD